MSKGTLAELLREFFFEKVSFFFKYFTPGVNIDFGRRIALSKNFEII